MNFPYNECSFFAHPSEEGDEVIFDNNKFLKPRLVSSRKENKIIEEVDEDTNQSQNGNILLNPLNPSVNTRIKNNKKNIPENPEDKLVGFLVGQVMKSSESKVNPGSVKEVLLKELFG